MIYYRADTVDILRLTGRDRQSFLQGMVTNEVASLGPGQGCYAFHLTSKGQVLADLTVVCLADALVLVTEPGWGEPLAASLEHHLVMERVRIAVSLGEAVGRVAGTGAAGELEGLGFEGVAHWAEGGNASDARGRLAYRSAVGYVLLDSAPLPLPTTEWATWEGLRIEAGVPRGQVDFDEKTLALETGQASRAIHFKKGCYIGQEIVARIDARGHTNRGLVGLWSASLLPAGARVHREGKEIGRITSAAQGPQTGRPVALGYLRHEDALPGTVVEVAGQSATVASLPFVGADE